MGYESSQTGKKNESSQTRTLIGCISRKAFRFEFYIQAEEKKNDVDYSLKKDTANNETINY